MSDLPGGAAPPEPTPAPAAELAAVAAPSAPAPASSAASAAPAADRNGDGAAVAPETPAADAGSRAPSLLSGDPPKPDEGGGTPQEAAVEGETPAEGETPVEGAKPAEPPPAAAEPLAYEKFAVPEGVSLDDERVGAFTDVIAPLRVPQEQAQQLVDLHVAEMQRYAEQLSSGQHRAFAETRRGWVESFEKDVEIGGNRRDTTIANALWAIGELGGDAGQVKELRDMLSFTGAGDHPALIRLMNNVALRLRERTAPPPALPPKPGGGGRPEDRRYGNMRS